MNEQEMLQRQKIEKREKVDQVIAYILIVILLGAIAFVLYAKFIMKNGNSGNPEEYTPSYITLDDISNSLNNSILSSRYNNGSANFSSSVSNNAIVVTYVKDDINLNLNIPLVNNELKVVVDNAHNEIITDIYKEIATIICTLYGNDETSCRTTIENVNNESAVNGIRFVTEENNNVVYINVAKPVEIQTITNNSVYNTATPVNLTDTNYKVEMVDAEVTNIDVSTNNTEVLIKCRAKSLIENNNLTILFKIYDENNNVLKENKLEYNENNPLSDDLIQVSFSLDDNLKLENIKKYSIEITR